MSPLLSVVFALGGASYAWRAYSSLYERQRAASQPFDPVTQKWWRILSRAVAVGLLSFVLVVVAAAVQSAVPIFTLARIAPPWPLGRFARCRVGGHRCSLAARHAMTLRDLRREGAVKQALEAARR